MIKTFNQFLLEKTSAEVLNLKRNQWKKITSKNLKEIQDEVFDLIQVAYAEIGGHAKIQKPEDILKDTSWNYWEGVDIHDTPDLDLIIWGKKTKFGVKFSGVGHDGEKDSKRKYLDQRSIDLKKLGYYIEVSGKLAEILMNKYNVPAVEDKDTINQVLGKSVEYHGDHPIDQSTPGKGWYTRKIGNSSHTKILLGKPKI